MLLPDSSLMKLCVGLIDRLSRCESEKLRRDRLNAYIGELAKIVPLVMQSNKKIDKASILRLTVTYLRIYHGLYGLLQVWLAPCVDCGYIATYETLIGMVCWLGL